MNADEAKTRSDVGRALSIGYLSPFVDRAESQAFFSLAAAADRLGHKLVHLQNSAHGVERDLDFVIAVSIAQPKLWSTPVFGAIHEPRRRLLEDIDLFRNLLTYDGYLTISPNLREFLDALSAGAGSIKGIGHYYNSPQTADQVADLSAIVNDGRLSLCYFGTNWDARARPLLRALSKQPYMRIYGPPSAWDYLGGSGYCGQVPFDGTSVQKIYADHGAGLVLLSKEHLSDDVISNRIFEITSVSAVAICPEMPWIQEHFRDDVLYYDPGRSPEDIQRQIEGRLTEIRADPILMSHKAARARLVFERRFSAEIMIGSAIDYFHDWQQENHGRGPDQTITVLLGPCGEAKTQDIQTTLESIDNQDCGRFRVVAFGSDLTCQKEGWKRIFALAETDSAHALGAQLREQTIASDMVAVLKPGNVWLSGHVRSMLEANRESSGAVVISSYLHRSSADAEEVGGLSLAPLLDDVACSAEGVAALPLEGLMIPEGAMDADFFEALSAGEDSKCVLSVVRRRPTAFTQSATIVINSGSVKEDLARLQELTDLTLRTGTDEAIVRARTTNPIGRYFNAIRAAVLAELQLKERREFAEVDMLAIEGGMAVPPLQERSGLEIREIAVPIEKAWGRSGIQRDRGGQGYEIVLDEPSSYCATFDLAGLTFRGDHWLVADLRRVQIPFKVGIVDQSTQQFVELTSIDPLRSQIEVWIPVPDRVKVSLAFMSSEIVTTQPLILNGLSAVREPAANRRGNSR